MIYSSNSYIQAYSIQVRLCSKERVRHGHKLLLGCAIFGDHPLQQKVSCGFEVYRDVYSTLHLTFHSSWKSHAALDDGDLTKRRWWEGRVLECKRRYGCHRTQTETHVELSLHSASCAETQFTLLELLTMGLNKHASANAELLHVQHFMFFAVWRMTLDFFFPWHKKAAL